MSIPRCSFLFSSGFYRHPAWVVLAVAVWPFIFLFPYTLNWVGIGNDYAQNYYVYKTYLLTMLGHGVFPLWSPTEACGYPFFSSPFAQAFYPLNALYFGYFYVFGRFAQWDYQLFTLLAVSIFAVGLYLWLRSLRVTAGIALAAAMLASISLKVTELLRFPNAINSAAWMPWLLFGMTLASARRHTFAGALIFGFSLLMLLTAGYPYFIIYSLFLLIPYAVAMLIRPFRSHLFFASAPDPCIPLVFVARLLVPSAITGSLCAPLLLNMQDLMAQTVDRGTPNFNYATGNAFGWRNTVGAWIFPPVSNMEGWYFFGAGVTLLIGCLVGGVLVRHPDYKARAGLVALVLSWMAFIIYFSWGRESVLFTWVWHHTPVLNQMRVWGRMSIILIPAIALLFSHAWQVTMSPPTDRARLGRVPLLILSGLTVGIAVAQWHYLQQGEFDDYWIHRFKVAAPDSKYIYLEFPYYLIHGFPETRFLWCSLAFAVFLFLSAVRRGSMRPTPGFERILLPAFVTLTAAELFILSSFQWTWPAERPADFKFDAMPRLASEFHTPRHLFSPLIMNNYQQIYGVGLFPNWGFVRHSRIYTNFVNISSGQWQPNISAEDQGLVKRFYGSDATAQRLFFTERLDQTTISGFMRAVDSYAKTTKTSARVVAFDGNRLRIDLHSERPAWLSYIDNWDPNWTATLDQKTVAISLCLGSYKAVPVPGGHSVVEFTYRPHWLPRRALTSP